MKKRELLAILFLFLLTKFSFAQAPIKEIEVQGLHSIKEDELIYLLGLDRLKEIKPEAIATGIKRAFRKGIFERITIEEDEQEPGRIIVKVTERDRIRGIDFKGAKFVPSKLLTRNFPFAKGEFMRYDLVESAASGLKDVMGQYGFPDARVSIKIENTPKPYSIKLVVLIEEGEPLNIREIEVIGAPQKEVLSRMRIREGDIFNQFRIKSGMDDLRKYYRSKGHYRPVVGPYTFADGKLIINVEPGERVETSFSGNTSISTRKLRRVLPFFEAEDVREDLINEAVQRMKSIYFEEGYPFVQIAPVYSHADGMNKVKFFFYEGKKVIVGSINITGTSADPGKLKGILASQKGKPYNPDNLETDMKSLVTFLQNLGYLDADVTSGTSLEENGMSITYKVKEGERFYIGEVSIEGIKSLPEEDIRNAVKIEPGDIYNEVDILDSRQRIAEIYNQQGFSETAIEVGRQFVDSKANIVFKINEGEKLLFGRNIIVGNQKTRRKIIERQMLHAEGSPYSTRVLLREQQKLYELGLFNQVNTEPLGRYDSSVDVVYRLKEAKAGAFEFGVGYGDFEKYRGFASVSYRNLFGLDRSGSLRFEFSSIEEREIVSYLEPYFLNTDIPFRAYLLREERTEKNIDTGAVSYKLRRYTATAGVQKALSGRIKGEVYYEFSVVKTWDVQPDVILSKEDVGTLAISAIRPALTFDSRDNPFDPKKGFLAGVDLKLASTAFLSQTNFAKVSFQANSYNHLGGPFVLALSARVGIAQGFAGTNELPIVERFFLGGRNTVRGYAQDTLGPKGANGTPIGGNAFLLGNLELRIKIRKSLGTAVFLDSGNVYPKISDISFGNIKNAVGAGIRYITPVGPLRVDYGYKLNREPDESHGEVHFSIGYAF